MHQLTTISLTLVIPTERGERAFTRGPITERSVGTGNVRVSSRGPRHASGFFACWGESDRGICSAQSQGSTMLFKAAPFPQVVSRKGNSPVLCTLLLLFLFLLLFLTWLIT